MAIIPQTVFPRSLFDMDKWFHPNDKTGPTALDLFDAFDELDHMMDCNLDWITKPEFPQLPLTPLVPQKYRIVVDCHGYQPQSIKTKVKGNKLMVSAHEEDKYEGEDFQTRQFKRTYTLPVTCETDKLVSFMTRHGQLVIEFPLRETESHLNQDLVPRILDAPDGSKTVSVRFNVPENIDPSKVTVSIKDRDLIVKAEDKIEKPDGFSQFYYYKRTTLPENTKFDELKCKYDNNQLSVTAPMSLETKSHRTVPIEGISKPSIEPTTKPLTK
jgi:HSP20 family molecular chaperone IbpA